MYNSSSRFYIITGGRGSGKSFEVNRFITLMTSFVTGHKVLFTRKTMTSAHLSIIPEFQEKIELLKLQGHFNVNKTELKSIVNSEIIFKGLKTSSGDQTAALKSLQGISTWVLDEAEELTDEATFDKINLSIRAKGVQNRVILILNPTTIEHWIYKRFFEQA